MNRPKISPKHPLWCVYRRSYCVNPNVFRVNHAVDNRRSIDATFVLFRKNFGSRSLLRNSSNINCSMYLVPTRHCQRSHRPTNGLRGCLVPFLQPPAQRGILFAANAPFTPLELNQSSLWWETSLETTTSSTVELHSFRSSQRINSHVG